MAMNVNKRLWSQLWEPTSSFRAASKFSRRPPNSSRPNFSTHSHTHTHTGSFFWGRSRPRQASLSKTSVRRSFASCGLLFIDVNPTTTVSSSAITTCTTTAEKSLYTTNIIPRQRIISFAQQVWRREIHSSSRRRERGNAKRNKSSTSNVQNNRKTPQESKNGSPIPPMVPKGEPTIEESESMASKYLHLPQMPKMPHRPSREELLAAATGFWSRAKVRFKWLTIRSVRPWNVDDWSAFVSWFVLGNIAWLVIGTTTFLSLVIYTVNTVVAQGMLAHLELVEW